MTRLALIIGLIYLAATSALADTETARTGGQENITLNVDGKPFILKHWNHQKKIKNGGCTSCHRGEIGKIEGWNMEFAHLVCIPCHDLNDKGPVKCNECHKEKKKN